METPSQPRLFSWHQKTTLAAKVVWLVACGVAAFRTSDRAMVLLMLPGVLGVGAVFAVFLLLGALFTGRGFFSLVAAHIHSAWFVGPLWLTTLLMSYCAWFNWGPRALRSYWNQTRRGHLR
jgi:hypothetical protein